MVHHNSYLALGDSYTIGESVPIHESFPYQTVQLLRKAKQHFYAPEIVAQTSWTSAELAEHVLHTQLNEQYDYVSLLIGVNNQYRGLSIVDFAIDFNFLLNKAVHLAGNKSDHVIVLSIPDWGCTPFAKEKDHTLISKEIDAFNKVCSDAALRAKAHFINITDETRAEKSNLKAVAKDQLHYSGTTHLRWSEKLTATIINHSIA